MTASKYIRDFPASARIDLMSASRTGTEDAYRATMSLIGETDLLMRRLSNVSMSDPRWQQARDSLARIEAQVDALRAANGL